MSRYVLMGTKNRGEKVGRIRLDDDRVLVLNGEPVEMSDEEHDNLTGQGYTLHKRPDLKGASSEKGNPDDNEPEHTEKGGVK